MSSEHRSQISELIRERLATGFDTIDLIRSDVAEVMGDEHDPAVVRSIIAELLPQLTAAHEAAESSWPAVTDCDRLDAAFEQLNALGIMARHNWTCCANCGRAEMPDEFERLAGQWNGKPIIGYVFYHQQGADAAPTSGCVYLSYGSTEPAESEPAYIQQCLAIARTACDVIRSHDLGVEWNGEYSHRIGVKLRWQRRAPPRERQFVGNDRGEC